MDGARAWFELALPAGAVAGVLPAVLIGAYVALSAGWFMVRGGRSHFRDDEAERRVTGLTSAGVRVFFSWLMRPWMGLLLRSRVSPNAVTYVSFVFALLAAAALAWGHLSLGGWLYLLAGVCDFFDGKIARARNLASAGGAALDSILDRYTEAAVLVGLAWFYRHSWVLAFVLLALVGSMLVPYVRARGESLQASAPRGTAAFATVGWLQRPERVIVLGTTVAFAPVLDVFLPIAARDMHWLTVIGIVAIAAGTQLTALQRTRHLVRALTPRPAASTTPSVSPPTIVVATAGAHATNGRRRSGITSPEPTTPRVPPSVTSLRGH